VANSISEYELPAVLQRAVRDEPVRFFDRCLYDQTEQMFIMLMQFPEIAGLDRPRWSGRCVRRCSSRLYR